MWTLKITGDITYANHGELNTYLYSAIEKVTTLAETTGHTASCDVGMQSSNLRASLELSVTPEPVPGDQPPPQSPGTSTAIPS